MLDERIRRGMTAQLAERRSRISAGDRPLGWKVGFGAPAAMNALGVDQPLVGHLMHSGMMESGAELRYAAFNKLAIEPEIAVFLGTGLDDGSDKAVIKAAISGLGPAIEIADVTFPPNAGPEKILAGNVYQKGIVLGTVDERRAGARLDGLSETVCCNGANIEIPDDLELNTGPILDVVAVVADTLAATGERLSAGELIIVGSLVPPLFPEAGTKISLELGDAEPLSIKVI